MGLSLPSRAKKMKPGWVDRLEAKALLTDKITGSTAAFADGCISFSSSCGMVHLCLPPSGKSPANRALGSIPSFSKVRPGQCAVMAVFLSVGRLAQLCEGGGPKIASWAP